MMEIKRFDTDFVSRTKEILLNYQGDYEVSNLINCTLGLIILPYEETNRNNYVFFDTNLDQIPSIPQFQTHLFDPIRKIERGCILYYPKTLKVLLQKMRHGLAHQHVEPINRDGLFDGVIIRNYYNGNKQYLDLEIEFSHVELKKFALFIADQYIAGAEEQ
jgi:hypothetical protein